jgi:hypothetical protein
LRGAVRIPFRFAEQEVNMLRHDYVPVNLKAELRRTRSKADSKIRRLASVINKRRR